MNLETLQEHLPENRVNGILPNEKEYRWITLEELIPLQYYIVYGDPGGDSFILVANDETEFNAKLPRWVTGNRNCDFATKIYLIVKGGEIYKPVIK